MSEHILSVFLSIQFSMLVGWAIYRFARVVAPKFGLAPSPRAWTRLARLLLAFSTAAAIGGASLGAFTGRAHTDRFPRLSKVLAQTAPISIASTPRSSEVRPDAATGVSVPVARFPEPTIADLFVAAITLFILALLSRAGRELLRLRALLRAAPRLRTIGRLAVVVPPGIASPFSFSAFGRSFIAVPEGLLETSRDLRIALAHEIEHVRAGHTAFAVLGEFAAAAAAPAAFAWKAIFTELHEFSCDEAVIGRARFSSHEYASCLVRVAEAALSHAFLGKGAVPAGTAGMATDHGNPKRLKSFLRRRMEMLMENGRPPSRPHLARVLGTLILATSALFAYAAGAMLKPSEIPAVNAGVAAVDPVYQEIAKKQLNDTLDSDRAGAALAIVANPQTGEILASVYVRSKEYARLHPSEGSAISRLVEPASTMKGIVLAAAIERGEVSPEDSIECANGSYRYGTRTHHDWRAFDRLSAADVIVQSSNIGGIRIAEKLGNAGLEKAFEDFGFGANSSVAKFPGARPGYLGPRHSDADWLADAATGFGVYVNPIELVQAYSAIANGGRLMRPIVAGSGAKPEEIRRVLSESTAKKMRTILGRVATEGTGIRSASVFYTSGGKTGTNYHPDLKEHDRVFGGDESVAHYVGFAPLDRPQVAVYVAIVDPKNMTVTGGRHAAPIFKEIMERSLVQMHVKPDRIPSP